MEIHTIGSSKKSARQFFGLIKDRKIDLLLDVRLNNGSRLAGFSKGRDLEYFLSVICNCGYKHDLLFAPTRELMDEHKSNRISTKQFDEKYIDLMKERSALDYFKEHYASGKRICLLCSESTPEKCHRRRLSNLLLKEIPDSTVTHLL